VIGHGIWVGTTLQVIWLIVLLWSRAAPNPSLVGFLIPYSIGVGALCWFLPLSRLRLRPSLSSLLAMGAGGGLVFAVSENRSFSDELEIAAIARFIDEAGVAAFFGRYAEFPWLGTRHPPLGPLMYGAVAGVLGPDLLALRLLSVACGVGLVAVTFVLGRTVYDRTTGLVAASLLVAMPYFVRLSGVAMFDVTLALLFTLTILLVASDSSRRLSRGLALGALIGTGLLLKYAMLLVYPVVVVWLAARRRLRESFGMLMVAVAVSGSLLGAWLFFSSRLGVLDQQARQVQFFVSYATTHGRTLRWMLESLLTRLPSAIGVYLAPVLLYGVIGAWRRRDEADVCLLLSVACIAVPLVLTLPDPRYFLPAFPLLAILGARAAREMPPTDSARLLLLIWLQALGSLVLFWGWERQTRLFLLR
jgi:4-amino-4-deoxy-L-arabinose transferase-like glycosyltransferase